MSRLSRFKKAPVMKFPKAPDRTNKSEDEDSDSDDDFIKKPVVIKPKVKLETDSRSVAKASQDTLNFWQSSQASFSKYFPACRTKENCRDEDVIKEDEPRIVKHDNETNKGSKRQGRDRASKTTVKQEVKVKEESIKSSDEVVPSGSDSAETVVVDEVLDGQPKTKCPFCFKDLANKLVGTTHIKSCAKELPTEQVIKVMELYERQIEEWKELGISHPAFGVNANNNKKAPGKTKKNASGKGGSRRKKNDDGGGADPEIELALALSISLHEEVESRKQKVKEEEFLLGAEVEIEEVKVNSGSRETKIKVENKDEEKPILKIFEKPQMVAPPRPSRTSQVTAPVVRRGRGKKIQLEKLPLYTANESEKKAKVAAKVSKILEEAETATEDKFFIREEGLVDKLVVPKRLIPYQNKDCTLWSLAQGGNDVPEDSFKVLDFSERPTEELEKSVAVADGHMEIDEMESTRVSPKRKSVSPLINNCHSPEAAINERKQPRKGDDLLPDCLPAQLKKVSRKRRPSSCYPPVEALKDLPPVVRDIGTMLYDRVGCDLIMYGREEKRIHCHKLIVTARCPKLLKEVIVETTKSRDGYQHQREIIPLTDYSHQCVREFVWYLYTGRAFSKDEELLSELKLLGSAYEVIIVNEEKRDQQNEKNQAQSSVEVSVSAVPVTMDSSTMTSDMDITETNSARITNDDAWNYANEDFSSSRDLFEEFEPQIGIDNYIEQQIDVDNCVDHTIDDDDNNGDHKIDDDNGVKHKIDADNYGDHKIDDDSYESDLQSPDQSPITQERKRSRRESPCHFLDKSERPLSQSQLFSATQMAYLIKGEPIPSDDNRLSQNYTSKSFEIEKEIIENNPVIYDDNDLTSSNEDKLLEAAANYEAIINVQSPIAKPQTSPNISEYRSRPMSRCGSTPNLPSAVSSSMRNFSFRANQDLDPFELDGDDTLFANLQMPNESSPVLCGAVSNVITLQATPPTAKSTLKPFSPKNILRHEPKIKLTSRFPKRKQEQTQAAKNLSQPVAAVAPTITPKNNNASPLLNYSLIDTPILKQELKKYGLKPLPRSKAKVLLRHIYHETHK